MYMYMYLIHSHIIKHMDKLGLLADSEHASASGSYEQLKLS